MPLLIGVGTEMLTLYILFANMRKVKINALEATIFIVFAAVAGLTIFRFVHEFAIVGVVANSAFVVIMTMMAYTKIKILTLSIIYAIFTIVILLWSATFASVVFDTITMLIPSAGYLGRDDVLGSLFWNVLYNGIIFIVGFFISRKAGSIFHKKILPLDAVMQKKMATYLLLSAFVTLALFFINVFLTEILRDMPMYVLIYAMVLTICFVALAFAVFAFIDSLRKEAELKHNTELLQNLESYTNHVESMATEMRQFRHDHRNLMIGFHSHVADRNWDRFESYYASYMDEFSVAETAIESCMDKLSNIQTPELKTILFLKFLQIQRF